MKYLITGGSGQLGFDIYRELINRGVPYYDIYKPTHEQFDITNWLNVLNDTLNFEPDVIFSVVIMVKDDTIYPIYTDFSENQSFNGCKPFFNTFMLLF